MRARGVGKRSHAQPSIREGHYVLLLALFEPHPLASRHLDWGRRFAWVWPNLDEWMIKSSRQGLSRCAKLHLLWANRRQ